MLKSKILLADDDTEDQSIIQEAMESLDAGHIVMFADNGEHLMDLLNKNFTATDCPCLIVLDLNMPKMSGAQTLSMLKKDEKYKNIPVVIYSTSINSLEKENCLLLGAHSFITKPVSFKESRQTAKTLLEFCQ